MFRELNLALAREIIQFSQYDHISPALGPESLTQGALISVLVEGFMIISFLPSMMEEQIIFPELINALAMLAPPYGLNH